MVTSTKRTIISYQGYSGHWVDILNPENAIIDIEEIAHVLSMKCRWGGHCNRFYSVAEHSCHVFDKCPDIYSLLHDSTETYLGDLLSPYKHLIMIDNNPYKDVEAYWLKYIYSQLGVDSFLTYGKYTPAQIKEADVALLHTEALQITRNVHRWAKKELSIPDLVLPCWGATEAKEQFITRYEKEVKDVLLNNSK